MKNAYKPALAATLSIALAWPLSASACALHQVSAQASSPAQSASAPSARVAVSSAVEAAPQAAVLPPRYLSVRQFKDCMSSEKVGSYSRWCMPAQQPNACPDASWQALQALLASDQAPACGAE